MNEAIPPVKARSAALIFIFIQHFWLGFIAFAMGAADPALAHANWAAPSDEQLERAAIQKALEENRWNRTRTAAQLGITFRALRYKLKKLGMD